MGRTQTRSQLLFQDGDVGGGAIIGPPRTFARYIGGRDDVNLVAQVIKRQQAVEEHQHAIGQAKIILSVLADLLQLPDRVVREVAHRARGERRQARHDRRAMLPQQFFDDLNRAALTLFFLFAALHHNLSTGGSHLHVRARSQKGVASNLLAALHRFQKKGIGLVGGDRQKG